MVKRANLSHPSAWELLTTLLTSCQLFGLIPDPWPLTPETLTLRHSLAIRVSALRVNSKCIPAESGPSKHHSMFGLWFWIKCKHDFMSIVNVYSHRGLVTDAWAKQQQATLPHQITNSAFVFIDSRLTIFTPSVSNYSAVCLDDLHATRLTSFKTLP